MSILSSPYNNKNGRIELIIGPMFSGKTTEIIRIANRYKSIGKNILAINHEINCRYGTDQISSHDKKVLDDCIIVPNLQSALTSPKFKRADIIIIEELQFFTDAFEYVTKFADEHHKIIVAAGLDGNYKREPFGDVIRLIPHAEKVIKLNAYCKECRDGTPAHFTRRLTKNAVEIEVGSDDIYEAVCRKHFHNPELQKDYNDAIDGIKHDLSIVGAPPAHETLLDEDTCALHN